MRQIKRRRVLAAAALAAALPRRIFAQTATSRPELHQSVQSGDVMSDGAIVWSRADRPSRMMAEYATTESFADPKRIEGPLALAVTDFTSRVRGLAPGQTVFYRVSYVDLGDLKTLSRPVTGRFRLPPSADSDVGFVWSADTVGQGYGINPDVGGMTIYEARRRLSPDFFVHSGDAIYADNPLEAEKKLPAAASGEHRQRRKIQGRRNAGRVPRQLSLRLSGRQSLALQCRRAGARPVGRPRRPRQLVLGEAPRRRRPLSREERAQLADFGQRAFREYSPLAGGLDRPMQLYR